MRIAPRLTAALLCVVSLITCTPTLPPAEPSGAVGSGQLVASAVAVGQTPRREALPVPANADERTRLSLAAPFQAFVQGDGRGWTASFDRRSGQPMFLEGPGLAWLPGLGNTLKSSDLQGANLTDVERADRLRQMAVDQAIAFLKAHPDLFGVPVDELALDDPWTGAQDAEGTMILVTFRYRPADVPVRDARLTFVVRHGNLIQLHAERLVRAPTAQPALSPEEGLAALKSAAQLDDKMELVDQDLEWVLLSPAPGPGGAYSGQVGQGYEPHLAYTFVITLPDDIRTLVAYVDARTGELLDLFDDNRYATVKGGIYPRTSNVAEVVMPFESARVSNGGTLTTDLGGNYAYSSGTASTALAGTFVAVSDSCGAPSASVSTPPGDLDLGTSTGTDCTFSASGHATRAARNAFYHLEHVRQMGKKWLNGVNSRATSWFASNLTANVNITQTCNAYWNGSSVNFFRSGGGCNNTGEIADVMQHEWGHGLDANTKSGSVGDSAKGEAVADTVALLMTHDKCVGPNFRQNGGGETPECNTAVRDLTRFINAGNISSNCSTGSCSGALGYECHCESHMLSGANYDLAGLFVTRYGLNEGWHQFERVYLQALPNITAYLPQTAGNAYAAMIAADDDDGNVTNGTPNADIIFQAFDLHGLAGTQYPTHTTICPTRPAAPVLTATAQASSAALSWTAVSGATGYTVLRNMTNGGIGGYLPIGTTTTATTFTDTQVANNQQYNYVVYASTGTCTTPLSAPASATPFAAAHDFALGINPTSATVPPGGSVTYTVVTTILNGTPETVTLSIAGLGAGLTASFNPVAVTAGGSSTLTITAANNAPKATSNFIVTGAAPSITHVAGARVTVYSRGNSIVGNGDFESGSLVEWASTDTVQPASTAHSGSWSVQVGSTGPTTTDGVLTQTIAVPGGSPSLSFWYKMSCPDTVQWDWLLVEIQGTTGGTLSTVVPKTCSSDANWVNVQKDLSAFSGQSVVLSFLVHDDGAASDPSYALVDDISVTVPVPDTAPPTVSVTSPGNRAVLFGNATLTANAQDDIGISKVEFYSDGSLVGTDTTAPYSVSWNTKTTADGRHTITARAYDFSGNIAVSTGVPITVNNTQF